MFLDEKISPIAECHHTYWNRCADWDPIPFETWNECALIKMPVATRGREHIRYINWTRRETTNQELRYDGE